VHDVQADSDIDQGRRFLSSASNGVSRPFRVDPGGVSSVELTLMNHSRIQLHVKDEAGNSVRDNSCRITVKFKEEGVGLRARNTDIKVPPLRNGLCSCKYTAPKWKAGLQADFAVRVVSKGCADVEQSLQIPVLPSKDVHRWELSVGGLDRHDDEEKNVEGLDKTLCASDLFPQVVRLRLYTEDNTLVSDGTKFDPHKLSLTAELKRKGGRSARPVQYEVGGLLSYGWVQLTINDKTMGAIGQCSSMSFKVKRAQFQCSTPQMAISTDNGRATNYGSLDGM
jgi:hypothetical protein